LTSKYKHLSEQASNRQNLMTESIYSRWIECTYFELGTIIDNI